MAQKDANAALDSSSDADLDDANLHGQDVHEGSDGDSSTPQPGAKQEGAEGAPDLLSIVQDVESGKDPFAPKADSPNGDAATKDKDQAAKDADAAAAPPEDYSDVGFHKHPRFQQLLRERDTYKEAHGAMGGLNAFLRENGVTTEEFNTTVSIAAALKTDPWAAWDALKPIVVNVLAATGHTVPEDLHAMVEKGELTVEAAQRLSVERARQGHALRVGQFREQTGAAQREAEATQALKDTANEWGARQEAADPTYKELYPSFQKELAWIMRQEGHPTTHKGVTDMLAKAWKETKASRPAASATPAPAATQPRNGDGRFVPQPAQRQAPPPRPDKRPLTGSVPAAGGGDGPTSMLDLVQSMS